MFVKGLHEIYHKDTKVHNKFTGRLYEETLKDEA